MVSGTKNGRSDNKVKTEFQHGIPFVGIQFHVLQLFLSIQKPVPSVLVFWAHICRVGAGIITFSGLLVYKSLRVPSSNLEADLLGESGFATFW